MSDNEIFYIMKENFCYITQTLYFFIRWLLLTTIVFKRAQRCKEFVKSCSRDTGERPLNTL